MLSARYRRQPTAAANGVDLGSGGSEQSRAERSVEVKGVEVEVQSAMLKRWRICWANAG